MASLPSWRSLSLAAAEGVCCTSFQTKKEESAMKRTIILLPLFLFALLSATNAENSKGARAVPHRIAGELKGTLTFVPFPDFESTFDVDTIGFASGIVKGLGQTHLFTFHRPTPEQTVIDGHVWIVAAGGDVIRCVYEGTSPRQCGRGP
jgi:hypothetical protein